MMRMMRGAGIAVLMGWTTVWAQSPPAAVRSAPLAGVKYEITFDSITAESRTIKVAMDFDVTGPGPVLLSFPAWAPGAYRLAFFARSVSMFDASAGGKALKWDKLDYDTWRVQPGGTRSVSVHFDFLADSLDNSMAWAKPDFLLFNGTNVLPYPEGRGTDFPATVTVKTDAGWTVATGMAAAPEGAYREGNYHDLWTNRSSWDASITTATRWPGCGPGWPPIRPAD